MTGEQVWGVIRTILAAGTGWVATQGWVDGETYTALIGALGTIFVAVWSIVSKPKKLA